MMRWVAQEEPNGCGIAALAMLTDTPYFGVKVWLAEYGIDATRRNGLTDFDLENYLVEHGYALARKYRTISGHPRLIWPPEPFADRHICLVSSQRGGHFVVMDRDGVVLDPARTLQWELNDYPEVNHVAAVIRMPPPGARWVMDRTAERERERMRQAQAETAPECQDDEEPQP